MFSTVCHTVLSCGVIRIGPFYFQARCHRRQLNRWFLFVLATAGFCVCFLVYQVHVMFCFFVFGWSVPVQLIVWKDSSLQWPVMCQVGCKTVLTGLNCISHCFELLDGKCLRMQFCYHYLPYPPLDNIWVMVIVWRLRGNIIRTALCWVVWQSVHSQQHTHVSSSYRSSRLGLSHWDPYAMHRGGFLELYYCNMLELSWWDSSLIWKTNWLPSVLWNCWFGHMTCKNRPRYYL